MREGWTTRKLGEVISLEYGKPLPKDKRCAEGGFPAYGANGIKCYAAEPYWEHPSIIVGRKGTAGAVNLVEGGFWPLDVTYYVTFDDSKYDRKFLYFMLSALDLPSLATGVKPGINRNIVYGIEQGFPALSEQKRIVAILDEAFEGIDTVVVNTEKNLANVRELFESYLNSVFSRVAVDRTESLSSLSSPKIITYGVIKLGKHIDDGVPCLRTSNVRRLRIDTDGIKKIDASLSDQYRRTILEGSEVLVSVRGTLGGVAVADEAMRGWNVSREVAVIPVDNQRVSPDFVAYSIATRKSQDWLVGVQKGVAYTGINLSDLRELTVPLPSLDEQHKVVELMNEFTLYCRELDDIHRHKLTALAELKQSLLNKAFSGELTANEAEAAVEEATA